jgi:hypothetical protein
MKATPTLIASNQDNICSASCNNAGDVMMMSPRQNEGIHVNYSTPKTKTCQKVKTMAVIAHCRRSKMHYKQKLVRILLDIDSDGNLIFVYKDTNILIPYSKRLVPQSWNTLNGIFQTKHIARMELNFFQYSDSKKVLCRTQCGQVWQE